MEELKPNAQRAKNVVVLIWIVLALEIALLISGYFQYNLLQKVEDGGEISAINATRELIISSLYLFVYIISGVTFIQWFRRAYFNLHQKVTYLSHEEGWAAGSWFVPIVNLYRPYQIMKELYKETAELLTKNGIITTKLVTAKLGWWWAFFIINGIFGQIVAQISIGAESVDRLVTITVANMISNMVGIALALITIKVIKDYSNVEPLLNELKNDKEISTY